LGAPDTNKNRSYRPASRAHRGAIWSSTASCR
jgi:hypothetical protein